MNIVGKVVKEYIATDDIILITFEDGSRMEIDIVTLNTSCHCHPEYEHSLDVAFSPA